MALQFASPTSDIHSSHQRVEKLKAMSQLLNKEVLSNDDRVLTCADSGLQLNQKVQQQYDHDRHSQISRFSNNLNRTNMSDKYGLISIRVNDPKDNLQKGAPIHKNKATFQPQTVSHKESIRHGRNTLLNFFSPK